MRTIGINNIGQKYFVASRIAVYYVDGGYKCYDFDIRYIDTNGNILDSYAPNHDAIFGLC